MLEFVPKDTDETIHTTCAVSEHFLMFHR